MEKNFAAYKGKSIDLSSFDTSKITDMSGMFRKCKSLTSLDLSNFNTNKVTYMGWMFQECSSLTSLDLSNFNTNKVTNMNGMFYDCENLTSLDISSFDFKKVEDVRHMFDSCRSLTNLKFGKNLKVSLDLSDCPLTYESVLSVINGLAKVEEQQELTLSKTTYKSLASEDIKLAETKNWKINS